MIRRLSELARRDWGLYAVRGSIVGLQLGTALVLAIVLGTAEFGHYAVMWALAILGSSLVSVGAPGLLLRELPARQAKAVGAVPVGATLLMTLAWPSVLAIGLAVTAIVGAQIAKGYGLEGPLATMGPEGASLVAAVAVGFNAMSSAAVFVRIAHGPSFGMIAADAMPNILALAATLFLWSTGNLSAMSLMAAVALLAAGALIAMTLVLASSGHFTFARDAVPYGPGWLAFWLNSVMGSLTAMFDLLIGGAVLTAETIGLYAIVKRMANFVSFPQIIANWSVATEASAAHATGDTASLVRIARRGVRLAFVPAVVIAVGVLLTLPVWSPMFGLPPSYVALVITVILLAGNLANVFFGANFIIASQCGCEAAALGARITAVVASLVLTALIVHLGLMTATALAAVTAAGLALMNAILWYVLKRRLGVDTSALSLWVRGQ